MCGDVDEVMYYNLESELVDLLASVQGHVRVIGSDYEGKHFTGKELASDIYYHDRNHNWSTTRFKTEIARQCIKQGLLQEKE